MSEAFARGVVFDLVAADHADAKIFGLGMAEVETADGTGGIHGEVFGEENLGVLFGLEEIEEEAFFGVIRAGGIAGRGTNAAIVFLD